MKIIANVLMKLSNVTNYISTKHDPPSEPSEFEIAFQQWLSVNGDRTLRITYNLDKNSIIFDVGGYEGQWTSDIFSKYQSDIYVFEPVNEFYENIRERFSQNPKILVFPFGLGSKNQEIEISLNKNASSTHRNAGDKKELVQMRSILDFVIENKLIKIDLLKINIEGGEFELLEHLIESCFIGKIGNIQVQFHNFVENAKQRRAAIHALLRSTHTLTYEYPFVWENWALNAQQISLG
jgi:FkbM family methyltransferase